MEREQDRWKRIYRQVRVAAGIDHNILHLHADGLIVGVLLWAVNAYVPMAPAIKKIFNIVVVLGLVIWLLWAFGVLGYLGELNLPHGHRLR